MGYVVYLYSLLFVMTGIWINNCLCNLHSVKMTESIDVLQDVAEGNSKCCSLISRRTYFHKFALYINTMLCICIIIRLWKYSFCSSMRDLFD